MFEHQKVLENHCVLLVITGKSNKVSLRWGSADLIV